MFHVKHLLFILLILPTMSFGQGSISMRDKIIAYPLQEDADLRKILNQSDGYLSLSAEEKDIAYYMNYARKNPSLFLTNAITVFLAGHPEVISGYTKGLQETFKSLRPLPTVLPDAALSKVSKGHAADLVLHKMISHSSSNGKSFQERLTPYVSQCASECINASQRFNAVETVLSLLFDFNVPDLGHRKTILDAKYSKGGFGFSSNPKWNAIVVIDFSCK